MLPEWLPVWQTIYIASFRKDSRPLRVNMRLVEDFVKMEIWLKYILFFGSRFYHIWTFVILKIYIKFL